MIKWFVVMLMLTGVSANAAADRMPWGTAKVLEIAYAPHKVIYDVVTGDPQELVNILDRVSFLNTVYAADPFESSIVVVIHGDAIPFFTSKHFTAHRELMERAQSLTIGTPVEFRLCRAAARMQGFEPRDVHGFVKMVPMADAEIVRLQREEGYAYMR